MNSGRNSGRAVWTALAVALLAAGCVRPSEPPELAIPVNARCTTCNDFILCRRDASTAGEDPVLLHLRPKTIPAQLATIFDYLLQYVRQRTEDRRPLTVLGVTGPGPYGVAAVTDLRVHRITFDAGWIDQRTGTWHDTRGVRLGRCTLLPGAEGRRLAARLQVNPAPGDPR